jgi:hypothetical protein
MVSNELEREYARRGIGLIDPTEGVAALLRELALPTSAPAQVVYFCGEVDAFGPVGPVGTVGPVGPVGSTNAGASSG